MTIIWFPADLSSLFRRQLAESPGGLGGSGKTKDILETLKNISDGLQMYSKSCNEWL